MLGKLWADWTTFTFTLDTIRTFYSHIQVPLFSFCETCSCCVNTFYLTGPYDPWFHEYLTIEELLFIFIQKMIGLLISDDNRNTFVWHLRERCCFETNTGWIYDWMLLFRLLVPTASWTPPPLFSGVRVHLPVHGLSPTLWGYFRD